MAVVQQRPGKRSGFRARLALWALCFLSPACGADRPPTALVLITVDTLRADRLGAYGSTRELTPHLDALAANSVVFEAAYAPAGFTFPSIASLLTGRYPTEIGIWSNLSAIPAEIPTLASILRDHGWRTGAVVSNYVLRDKAGLAPGFDVYDDTMEQAELVRQQPERIASHTTQAALAVHAELAEGDAAWMLWVHYQDPHGPYTPPEGLRERYIDAARAAPDGRRRLTEPGHRYGAGAIPPYQMIGEEREVAFYRAGYHAEIRATDDAVGALLEALSGSGALDDALLVFAADHGEALGEHGHWFAHGHHLTDELVHVPLLVQGPGLVPTRRRDVACLVDLLPSVLGQLGIPAPADSAGRDLFAVDAEHQASVPFFTTLAGGPELRFGVLRDGYKLILTQHDSVWRPQLFRQGAEEVDLAVPAPQLTKRLRSELDTLRRRYVRGAEESRQSLSEEEERKLRALGYLEDGPAP